MISIESHKGALHLPVQVKKGDPNHTVGIGHPRQALPLLPQLVLIVAAAAREARIS